MQRAGPRLPHEQLLDRYNSHTKHCAACSGALRNVERGQAAAKWGAAGLAFVYAAVALSGGAGATTVGLAAAGGAAASTQGGLVAGAGQMLLRIASHLFQNGASEQLMVCQGC